MNIESYVNIIKMFVLIDDVTIDSELYFFQSCILDKHSIKVILKKKMSVKCKFTLYLLHIKSISYACKRTGVFCLRMRVQKTVPVQDFSLNEL